MIVVAVLDLDVDARVRHPARDLSELAGLVLPQALNQDLVYSADANPYGLERTTRRFAVLDQEMRDTNTSREKRTSPFDAHPSVAERFAHARELAGPVLELDL